jgi:hypothetical protein
MAFIPCYCNNPYCKTVFPIGPEFVVSPGKEAVAGIYHTNIYDEKPKCPRCGFLATVYPGTYRFTGQPNSFGVLISGKEAVLDLIANAEAFIRKELSKEKPDKAAVVAAIEKVSPALADISRKTFSTGDYIALAALLLGLLNFLKDIHLGYFNKDDSKSIPQQYIDYLTRENIELKEKQKQLNLYTPYVPEKKPTKLKGTPNRNSICPCGSGKKFKKCHALK